MPEHPLAEVFGFPITNMSKEALRYRKRRLCPFNNKVPNCTKDKASDSLGVCSVYNDKDVVITCPVRFRQDWVIAEDAAAFFFPHNAKWTSLVEVRLDDKNGESAGNIDVVLVAHDDRGRVLDYGALEIQAVYISGNVRRPFEYFMEDTASHANMTWRGKPNYPRPDYLSSSRKRLAPQLMFKGGILHAWNRKMAVALNKGFFQTLPALLEVEPEKADIAWLIYGLRYEASEDSYILEKYKTIYTEFEACLDQIAKPAIGEEHAFMERIQVKLDEKLDDGDSPDNQTINLEI